MTIDIDEAKVNRNPFALWLGWTLATALGMIIGYLPMALLIGPVDLGIALVMVPIIAGVVLGLAQWIVLRSYVVSSHDWVLNNAVGWVVGFALGLFIVQALAQTTASVFVGFVAFGIIVALFQWPVLRREIPHLFTWILANVIGWTLGAFLSQLAVSMFFQNSVPDTITSVLVTVGITGLVAGAVTAIALILIVRQPDRAVSYPSRKR